LFSSFVGISTCYSPNLRGLGGAVGSTKEQVRASNRNTGGPTVTTHEDIGFRCMR